MESHNLSEDCLMDILSRLTVKPLLRFKCVCRLWLYLIDNPGFATKQLTTARCNLSDHMFHYFFALGLQSSYSYDTHYLLSYDSFDIFAKFKSGPFVDLTCTSPCDGIVCLYVISLDERRIAVLLWNPAIREINTLPLPPTLQSLGAGNYDVSYVAFGIDPKTNDYKVVMISYFDMCFIVEVYSTCTNSWKILPRNSFQETMKLLQVEWNDNAVQNGKMYNWISQFNHALISFDLIEYVFIMTPMHKCESKQSSHHILLQSNNRQDNTHVMCYCNDYSFGCLTNNVQILMLDGYGTEGCWNKQVTITLPYFEKKVKPFGYWKNEEIICIQQADEDDNERPFFLEREESEDDENTSIDSSFHGGDPLPHWVPLVYYNPITQQLKPTKFKWLETAIVWGYIESLVSVKELCRGLDEQYQQLENDDVNQPILSLREVNQLIFSP